MERIGGDLSIVVGVTDQRGELASLWLRPLRFCLQGAHHGLDLPLAVVERRVQSVQNAKHLQDTRERVGIIRDGHRPLRVNRHKALVARV